LDITASSLVKANTNGNPGFSVRILSAQNSESCQGTLIRATDSTCTVALAAHCLYHSIAGSSDRVSLNQPACGSVKGQSAKSGNIKVEMADFGTVSASAVIHPQGASDSGGLHDVGIFSFSCPQGAKTVPVVPVSADPMIPGETVWYGKVKGNYGLWEGKAAADIVYITRTENGKVVEQKYDNTVYADPNIKNDNTRHIVKQSPEKAIVSGDSGGPAMVERNGQKVLVGILTGTVAGSNEIAAYQTNSSIDFLKCFAGDANLLVAQADRKLPQKESTGEQGFSDFKPGKTPAELAAAKNKLGQERKPLRFYSF
jgi:hypothetical protein